MIRKSVNAWHSLLGGQSSQVRICDWQSANRSSPMSVPAAPLRGEGPPPRTALGLQGPPHSLQRPSLVDRGLHGGEAWHPNSGAELRGARRRPLHRTACRARGAASPGARVGVHPLHAGQLQGGLRRVPAWRHRASTRGARCDGRAAPRPLRLAGTLPEAQPRRQFLERCWQRWRRWLGVVPGR